MRDAACKGFALVIGASGKVSYPVQFRDADGKQRLYTLPVSVKVGD